jgi:hypothetical protein
MTPKPTPLPAQLSHNNLSKEVASSATFSGLQQRILEVEQRLIWREENFRRGLHGLEDRVEKASAASKRWLFPAAGIGLTGLAWWWWTHRSARQVKRPNPSTISARSPVFQPPAARGLRGTGVQLLLHVGMPLLTQWLNRNRSSGLKKQ